MTDEAFEDPLPPPPPPPPGITQFVRDNPIGAVAAALIVGVLLGRIGIL